MLQDVDDEEEDDDDVADEDVEKHMDVPPSWTLPIEISSEGIFTFTFTFTFVSL